MLLIIYRIITAIIPPSKSIKTSVTLAVLPVNIWCISSVAPYKKQQAKAKRTEYFFHILSKELNPKSKKMVSIKYKNICAIFLITSAEYLSTLLHCLLVNVFLDFKFCDKVVISV